MPGRAIALLTLVALACVLPACGGGESRVSASEATDPCPPDWPGPWTECPEAKWVGRVAESAGYRLAGDTGSALVAEGGGHSFYIWATEYERPFSEMAADEEWKRIGRVDGIPVYGDRTLWRWWPAQGFVFWLQAGPRGNSTLPPVRGMRSLVHASQNQPPPRS
jgi:hypothetical protein